MSAKEDHNQRRPASFIVPDGISVEDYLAKLHKDNPGRVFAETMTTAAPLHRVVSDITPDKAPVGSAPRA